MPKKQIKRIRLDAPNEQILQVRERLIALEEEVKKQNPEFEKPISR